MWYPVCGIVNWRITVARYPEIDIVSETGGKRGDLLCYTPHGTSTKPLTYLGTTDTKNR